MFLTTAELKPFRHTKMYPVSTLDLVVGVVAKMYFVYKNVNDAFKDILYS